MEGWDLIFTPNGHKHKKSGGFLSEGWALVIGFGVTWAWDNISGLLGVKVNGL